MPFVYIVRCADGTFYTGWAVDPAERVKTHNAGRGAKYTRTRLPVRLVYSEELPTRAEAMKRERTIKRYPRAKKQELCQGGQGPKTKLRPPVTGQRTARPVTSAAD